MAKNAAAAAVRRERAAAARKAQEARERRRRLLAIVASVLAGVVVVGGLTAAILVNRANQPSLDAVQSFSVSGKHVAGPVKYAQNPPAGGDHNAVWLNCGVYDQPVPNENAVHALEHGAVWITYRPDLRAADVEKLRAKVRGKTYLVLSPFINLPAPVVASAWGKQLRLTGADDDRLDPFLTKYRQGPQAPEPGAACDGGTGTPL